MWPAAAKNTNVNLQRETRWLQARGKNSSESSKVQTRNWEVLDPLRFWFQLVKEVKKKKKKVLPKLWEAVLERDIKNVNINPST